jgi:hypothetical protein
MSPSAHRNSGAPTFIATSASLSLSGLEAFGAVMDPNLIDTPAWYPEPGEPHHAPLSPQHEHFSMNFGPGFTSHSVPVSHEALHRKFISPHTRRSPSFRILSAFLFPVGLFPNNVSIRTTLRPSFHGLQVPFSQDQRVLHVVISLVCTQSHVISPCSTSTGTSAFHITPCSKSPPTMAFSSPYPLCFCLPLAAGTPHGASLVPILGLHFDAKCSLANAPRKSHTTPRFP